MLNPVSRHHFVKLPWGLQVTHFLPPAHSKAMEESPLYADVFANFYDISVSNAYCVVSQLLYFTCFGEIMLMLLWNYENVYFYAGLRIFWWKLFVTSSFVLCRWVIKFFITKALVVCIKKIQFKGYCMNHSEPSYKLNEGTLVPHNQA